MTPTEERHSADEAARVAMDPRIRERRIKVRRDEGRRRLRVLGALVTVALAVAASVGASHSALLDVDHVRVEGATQLAPADVVRAAGLDRHRYMISVDGGAVARRVRALPWVSTARVERQWPGTIRIVVTERTPVAALAAGTGGTGGTALVDGTGRVLADVPAPPAGLLRIDGTAPAPDPGQRVDDAVAVPVTVAAALPDNVRARIASITSVDGDVQLRIAGASAIVRMGGIEQLDAKMVALATLLARADTRDLQSIDVRVPAAPVLTRVSAGR